MSFFGVSAFAMLLSTVEKAEMHNYAICFSFFTVVLLSKVAKGCNAHLSDNVSLFSPSRCYQKLQKAIMHIYAICFSFHSLAAFKMSACLRA
jgi:hypothetical protein